MVLIKNVKKIWFEEKSIDLYNKEDRKLDSYPRGHFGAIWLNDLSRVRIEKIDGIEQPVKVVFDGLAGCEFDERGEFKELWCAVEE